MDVAAGAAMGDDGVTVVASDDRSVTLTEVDGGALRLIQRGAGGATRVL